MFTEEQKGVLSVLKEQKDNAIALDNAFDVEYHYNTWETIAINMISQCIIASG